MKTKHHSGFLVVFSAAAVLVTPCLCAQATRQPQPKAAQPQPQPKAAQPAQDRDAIAGAQAPRPAEVKRPEQRLTEQDRAERFSGKSAPPSSPVFKDQPKEESPVSISFAIRSTPTIR